MPTFKRYVIPRYLGLYYRFKLLVLSCSAPPSLGKQTHVELKILFTITLHLKITSYLKKRAKFPLTWEDSSENHDALIKHTEKSLTMISVSFGVNLYKHTFLCALRPSKILKFITLLRSVYIPKILAHGL